MSYKYKKSMGVNFLKLFSTFSTLIILDLYTIIGHNFCRCVLSYLALIQTSLLFSFKLFNQVGN